MVLKLASRFNSFVVVTLVFTFKLPLFIVSLKEIDDSFADVGDILEVFVKRLDVEEWVVIVTRPSKMVTSKLAIFLIRVVMLVSLILNEVFLIRIFLL